MTPQERAHFDAVHERAVAHLANLDAPESCVACDVAFVAGDLTLADFDGGYIHVDCCGEDNFCDEEGNPIEKPAPQVWEEPR